jgi:hypothetical protein
MLLVPEPMVLDIVLDPVSPPDPMAPLLAPVEPELPELMLDVSVLAVDGARMVDGVLDDDGMVVVSSVFLLQAPSASSAASATAVAMAGLSLDANM